MYIYLHRLKKDNSVPVENMYFYRSNNRLFLALKKRKGMDVGQIRGNNGKCLPKCWLLKLNIMPCHFSNMHLKYVLS